MKRIAILIFALSATPLLAQGTGVPEGGAQEDYPVIGSVPDNCQLGEPIFSSENPPVNVQTLTGRIVTIDELMDRDTLSTQATSVELAFAGFCNFPHRIVVESDNNGLFRQSAGNSVATGFANAVPYSAELRWADETIRLDADALTRRQVRGAANFTDPVAGSLLLRLQIQPGATNVTTEAPLLAGEYRDVIRITVGPQ